MGMGGRGHHQAPVHPKAAPSKPVPQDKTVQQTMDDNDAEAYENAERSVLKAAQFDRAGRLPRSTGRSCSTGGTWRSGGRRPEVGGG